MAVHNYIFTLVCLAVTFFVAPVFAQDSMDEASISVEEMTDDADNNKKKKTGKKSKKEAAEEADDNVELSPVGTALQKLKTLTGKANVNADYYIYLSSSSWCRFCRECMPIAVKEYAKIRRSKKVELIIINGDRSAEEAQEYVKSYKAKCPYILFDEVKNAMFQNLPGSSFAIGAPAAAIVTKTGELVKNGQGAKQVKELLSNWKKLTLDADKRKVHR